MVPPVVVEWQTLEEMAQGWPVMQGLYPQMTQSEYLERLEAVMAFNYRQFAAFIEERCVGVLGLWLFPRLWCGLQADVDNFVVDETYRSQGVGKLLLETALAYAKDHGADIAVLDTFVDNPASHRFYFREGFVIRGFHFVKPL